VIKMLEETFVGIIVGFDMIMILYGVCVLIIENRG